MKRRAVHTHVQSVELFEFTDTQAFDVRQVQQRGLNKGCCEGSLAHDVDQRGIEGTTCEWDIISHRTRRALVHKHYVGLLCKTPLKCL